MHFWHVLISFQIRGGINEAIINLGAGEDQAFLRDVDDAGDAQPTGPIGIQVPGAGRPHQQHMLDDQALCVLQVHFSDKGRND